jgi:hypothetical protein
MVDGYTVVPQFVSRFSFIQGSFSCKWIVGPGTSSGLSLVLVSSCTCKLLSQWLSNFRIEKFVFLIGDKYLCYVYIYNEVVPNVYIYNEVVPNFYIYNEVVPNVHKFFVHI